METRNVKPSKEVGFAIHGLRAYIKALELSKGVQVSTKEYRYDIALDRTTARIVTSADSAEVEGTNRSLADWAKIGKDSRLGLIGLKSEKDEFRAKGEHVQYTLNVLTGDAYLSKNGQRLEDQPQTIADWAKKGRDVERQLFNSLNAAVDHCIDDVAEELRKKMIRLGVIREPRAQSAAGEAEGSADVA